ncbi:hypothetical protein ABZS66_29460 [Dactylosporangium sp. NPDC005572]|uniref:hypothetical protein n=1 Tax=Dactylosporangium sp. NPDC005572 TaxID=3156889 RepID=UPI0033ADB865
MTPDALAMIVAAAIAAKGAEVAVASGRGAAEALVRLVRARLRRRGPDAAALEAVVERPADPAGITALAAALHRAMVDDPGLAARLRAALPAGDVVNHFGGTATKVVQARDIHGNVVL